MPTFNLKHRTLDTLRVSATMASDLKLPQKAAFALLKNATEITRHLKDYDAKSGELLNEFALKDDDGKPMTTPLEGGRVQFKLDPSRIEEFASKRNELDDFVVENVTIHMVTEAAFVSDSEVISPRDLALIAWMIEGLTTLESES